jgi:endonuclease/exonuclease/phosphatase family metal-dependent hydrolase
MVIRSFFPGPKAALRNSSISFAFCFTLLLAGASLAEEPGFTVMTFNIRWDGLDEGVHSWENRKGGVAGVIRNYAPDIIALQEASPRQTRYLQGSLPGYESFISKHERAENQAFLFNTKRFTLLAGGSFWLIEYSNLRGGTRRAAWVQLMQLESKRCIYIYNVHLDGRSPEARKRSVINLMNRIRDRNSTKPFLVMGDFNAVETSHSISYLKGEIPLQTRAGDLRFTPLPLIDAARRVFPTTRTLGTAHGFGGGFDGARLDYIFVSDDFVVRSARVAHDRSTDGYPSDHFPVIVELELKM